MPDITNLREKIDALLPFARHILVSGEERLTRRSLMRYLWPHLDDRRMSLMIGGRSEKGIPPGRISDPDFKKLAALLASVIGGDCSSKDAELLWKENLEAFLTAIAAAPRVDLFATLKRAPVQLEIGVQKKKKSTLRAILSAQVVPEDAFIVTSKECLQFIIGPSPGQRLMVLCHEPGDVWRLIAPGHLHDGVITEESVLPKAAPPWLPVDAPFGLHKFVFIALDARLEGLLPHNLPDDRILTDGDIGNLARRLANPAIAKRWRWAMKTVNAIAAT